MCTKHKQCGLEGSKGGKKKQGNTEHTVAPNVEFWNIYFLWKQIVLLKIRLLAFDSSYYSRLRNFSVAASLNKLKIT
jgi:hypothetical protein